ncbi:MAG: S8 family serine peptidase [Calditrichaceae bacterium]
MNLNKVVVLFIMVLVLITGLHADDWSFLDIDRVGARSFVNTNPEYNGNGVVIIILDTGIDMGVQGLENLPNGDIKVIDVQDFSGEGDVYIEQAERGIRNNEKYIANPDSFKLFGIDKISHFPKDSIYYIGIFKEKNYVNAAFQDFNNNGKTDDQFGVCVMNSETDGWLAYIDLDGDGNIHDEKPMWNYKKKHQAFQFRGRNINQDRNPATFALNIFPDENRVSFHFDGNGHGTHCAGIAAGYRINGQDGLSGVAPGAKLISLKIGDGRLSGGATITGSMLSAYEYGIEFAKNYDGPVVFSMSYGIGSEVEGMSDMDLMLDELANENEQLLFVVSAGNEGPGISTIGLPAASKRALTVGAIYTPKIAANLYEAGIKKDVITSFSSRGGEINKPDVLTPGAASSTIPPYSNRDVKGGTSMAAPQAAGSAALIMSALYNRQPRLPITGALIKKALRYSAEPLQGYLPLEQGGGVINITKALEFYKSYIKSNDQKEVLAYNISTVSPIYKTGNGPAAYWRFGDYAPGPDDKQRFYIHPVFPKSMNADQKYNFYRGFDLVPSEPWIKVMKNSTYIKGDNSATVDVYYDQNKIAKPGIYNGKITAFKKGGFLSGRKAENIEFDILCTIIKPITFSEANHHKWNSEKIRLAPGQIHRIFYEIPLKASSGIIRLKSDDEEFADVRAYLFDPEGRESARYIRFDNENRNEVQVRLSPDELVAGTWELDFYSDIRNIKESDVQVEINFSALETIPQKITSVIVENGTKPKGRFSVINYYNKKIEAQVHGEIMGIQRTRYLEESSDKMEYYFSVDENHEKVEFDLELTPDVFNMFTDFAVNIKDYSGKILKSDGFTYRKLKISWRPPVSGDYILEFIPGFAGKDPKNWQIFLKESYYWFNEINIESSRYNFYPNVEKTVDFSLYGTLPVAPDGFYLFGQIWMDEIEKYRFRHIVPVELYTGLND